jgi:endonuclease YncB( thermonuclease family)
LSDNDYACHDGANWIKLSQVPGITPKPEIATQPVTQAKPKKRKKIRKVRLVVVSLCVLLLLSLIGLSIVGLINLMPDDGDESASSNELFILTPDQIVDVYDGDTFKIDLPRMHPLFGDDLSIRLFGVDTPEMRGTSDEVKALAMQAQQLTEKALKGASKIALKNPQRGKYFRVVCEVWIDGESLAEMLKAKGLAKDYDGEGARPEW